jgi:hypothetical protein
MRILISILFSLVFVSPVLAQKEQKEGLGKGRMFLGGDAGFSFGSNQFSFNVSPQLGYYFTDGFAAGGGLNYVTRTFKIKAAGNNLLYKENYSVVGVNVFARVFPAKFLFVELQPEMNQVWIIQKDFNPVQEMKFSKTVPSLLGGVGGILHSGNGGMMVKLQYDLLQREFSPYTRDPFFSVGYIFGL